MPRDGVEEIIALARELLRPEALPSFAAAWEWAEPRMRTEAEARLTAALLVVLHGSQALVAPRRLAGGALASLHVTGTRSAPGGPVRRHCFVYVTPNGAPLADAEPDSLCFSADETRAAPFRCAAHVLGELLTRLLEGQGDKVTR